MVQESRYRSRHGLAAVAALALAGMIAASAWSDPPKGRKSDAVVKVTATGEKPDAQGKQVVALTLRMDKGWHTYANPTGADGLVPTTVQVNDSNARLVQVTYPEGRLVVDKDFGKYRVYEDQIVIKAVVQRTPGNAGPVALTVKLQACDKDTCLQPATVNLTVP